MIYVATDNVLEPPMNLDRLNPAKLEPADFAEMQRRLGLSDADLATTLGLSEKNGKTRIREIKRGARACSEAMALNLITMLRSHRDDSAV